MFNTGDIPSTIGRSFTTTAIANPEKESNNKYFYFQTILMDEDVLVEVSGCHSSYGKLCVSHIVLVKELRVKDYQLGGRPPSYPPKSEFCGVALALEKPSLFDVEEGHSPTLHPNDIEESYSPPRHLNNLWYDDGSVVLKAGDDFFRVHSSILSQKSSVFATLLLQSQAENTETHKGCPMVTVGDDAEELRQLLLTIYEISYACILKYEWLQLTR